MKRIVFLIIASLLVIGLVLPGCGPTEPDEDIIKIAVCGPMDDIQGENHLAGAEMARDEINLAGGVNIGGTPYDIELVEVDTEEATEGEDGSTGKAELLAVIDDVAFCVGGFRTEVVSVYRDAAIDAGVLFMNCGAATGALQYSVVEDYDTFKYWFKATPYNETFLVKSLLKMTSTIGGILKATLEGTEAALPDLLDPDYEVSSAEGGKLRVEILGEEAEWDAVLIQIAQAYLPALGFNVTGTTKVSPTAPNIDTELGIIGSRKPHIIFTAFSGSVGAVYSSTRVTLGIPAMSIGINVPGQSLTHWDNTGGDCVGEIMLDTFAVNMSITDTTLSFFDDFVTKTSDYPVYTAATYDAIYAVCEAIEAVGLDTDAIIDYLEDLDNARTGIAATTAYYPMPADDLGAGLYALNETQVLELYPGITDTWIRFNLTPPYFHVTSGYAQSDWLCGDPASEGPHIAHDTVYGPDYQTGIASQWQLFGSEGVKVGVWPRNLGPSMDVSLTDQYGCWNFQYDGTMDLYIPIDGFYA